ncbi:MAG TPA: ATPase, partial [Cyanobacteria bacterium UBA12227]|nr:ATPase [Cyanobacteria bacterium UBA12227]
MGTTITYGRALAVVTETGMNTELGQIATAIQSIDREATPLQQRLDQLGGVLAIAILVFVIVIFCLGLLRGEPVKLMFLMAVSLAVAAIPEGLPAVVTIALALGASRMLKQHALIRKLPAVETLGSVTAICSDKTGTLTQNRMTVTCLDVMGHRVDLTEKKEKETTKENNFYPLNNGEEFNLLKQQSSVGLLLTGAALCNDALLEFEPDKSNQFQAIGDPTESALVVAAAGLGLWKTDLENTFERIAEVPFDAERKRMTTIHQLPITNSKIPDKLDWVEKGKLIFGNFSYIAFTKGAVDSLLNVCSQVWINGKIAPLSDFWYKFISHNNDQLAGDGIRVLGVAFRPLEQQFIADLPTHGSAVILEQNLVFVGIIG